MLDSLKALLLRLAEVNDVMLATAMEMLPMTLLGGLATCWGLMVGFRVVVIQQNHLATLGGVVPDHHRYDLHRLHVIFQARPGGKMTGLSATLKYGKTQCHPQ
ncbi:hypothetical protein [Polaromonas sp. OV174]|uniref:hypothetical protein n=1 Tax=Polaromonas sp. OV174 TaxID=1855300 RepID=UPI00116017AB|nr:hypothetical protein [Polaromonas sp. OV174]